jgi:ribose 5-phosphate isomerase B
MSERTVITEADVLKIARGAKLHVTAETILTPSARDRAAERGIEICRIAPGQRETIALASDHAGFQLKESLKSVLTELGYHVHDFGAFDETPVDYPDMAYRVAESVSQGKFARGIIVDGAGIGSCMAANKLPGVRAAMCYDPATARNSREHNDANVLTLGARMIGDAPVREIVAIWLSSQLTEDRHRKRVEKIAEIERKHLR